MTPYTKKIVELHKIHKAIEEKDCCNGGGSSDDSSKEVTIDDIVKFIHDNHAQFSYTKYNDIPETDYSTFANNHSLGSFYRTTLIDLDNIVRDFTNVVVTLEIPSENNNDGYAIFFVSLPA